MSDDQEPKTPGIIPIFNPRGLPIMGFRPASIEENVPEVESTLEDNLPNILMLIDGVEAVEYLREHRPNSDIYFIAPGMRCPSKKFHTLLVGHDYYVAKFGPESPLDEPFALWWRHEIVPHLEGIVIVL